MPNPRRHSPSSTFRVLWILSLFVAGTFAVSMGSATARAEGEPPPTASEEPSEPPPPPQCGPPDTAGLLPTGSQAISGTVTDAAGNPLTDLEVRISTTGSKAEAVYTNAEGHYIFEGLGDGSYLVSFFDLNGTFRSGFYDGAGSPALTPAEATRVELSGTGATGVNVVLSAESLHAATGSVRQFGGAALSDALVYAYAAYFPMVACAATGADGSYALTNVRTGAYRLSVTRNGFPTGFYRAGAPGNFTTHFSEATVLVIDTDLSAVDIAYPELFSLTGLVRDAADNAVGGFYVGAAETIPGANGYGFSDELGQFTIEGLPAGEYLVNYSDSNQIHQSGWYAGDGQLSATPDGAVPVTVPGPAIELLADPAPTITGTIRNDAAELLADVQVNFCEQEIGACFSATTGADGAYTASIPQAGDYTAQVWDNTATYPGGGFIQADGSISPGFETARHIPISTSSVTDVDGILPGGGVITATLTSGGGPVPYPYVSICRSELACGDSTVTSDEFGNATSPVLFAGTYYLQDPNTGLWLVDAGTASAAFDDATPVLVTAGGNATITSDIPAPGAPTDAGELEEPVTVGLGDTAGGDPPPVTVTFSDVTVSGTTTLTISESGDPVPSGFQLGLPATYYDISTTAEYAIPIIVCISYAGVQFANGVGLELYHYDASIPGWDPITTEIRVADQVICGQTNSLSPFVIVERIPTFAGFFQPVDNSVINRAKAGSGIPVKFSLGGDFGLDVFLDGYPSVSQIDCPGTTADAIEQTVTVGASHLVYDAANDQYVYQLKTAKSWAGTCRRLTMVFTDGTTRTADFQFTR